MTTILFSRRRWSLGRATLSLCAFIVALVGAVALARPSAAAQPTLRADAPAQVRVGEPIRVTLAVADGADIAGFEAQLLFDPAAAEFAGMAERDSDARRGGRDLRLLSAPELPNGAAVALVSCLRADCVTQRGPTLAGARGPVRLATVEILPLRSGTLEIGVAAPRVVNAAGEAVAVALATPALTVQVGAAGEGPRWAAPAPRWALADPAALRAAPRPFDLTGDGRVTHADLMEVALEWQITHERGSVCGGFDTSRDLNRDGCLDVADLQLVAARLSAERQAAPDAPQSPASTFTVNSTGDQWDSNVGNGICLTSTGTCTLRAAIQEANARSGANTIGFNIAGGGVQTIQLGQRLPTLYDQTGGTTIDGYTQPGSVVNTDTLASNAVLMVQIIGTGEGGFDGLPITSPNNVVRGLAIHKVSRSLWIYGTAAANNLVAGCWIGTDAAGVYGSPSLSPLQAHGIHIERGADRNRIGTAALADRNVISGNGRHGIGIWHGGTTENVVVNSIIGLNPTGTLRLANHKHGLDINFSASLNRFGGTAAGERNVISGNEATGVQVSHESGTTQNQVIGNFVGTDLTGTVSLPHTYNRTSGILLKDRVANNVVSDNVVGGNVRAGIEVDNFGLCCTVSNRIFNNRVGVGLTGTPMSNGMFGLWINASDTDIGPNNIIAHNPVGIQLEGDGNDGNTITANSIYSNTGLGIDIAPIAAVNANDEGDADAGPNEQQNFPVLAAATTQDVTGSACAGCKVEIFVAEGGADSYGEGQSFVASGVTAADGTFRIRVTGLAVGSFVTATATDAAGNTSEFSLNTVVTEAPTGVALPGRIEAEDYREGGAGVGYHDTTPGNTGGVYRADDVDIQATQDTSGGYNIAWVVADEWLAYDVIVETPGTYRFHVRAATRHTGRRVRIEVDGVNVTGSIALPNTGGFQTWTTVSSGPVFLEAGQHTLKLVMETSSVNVNFVDVTVE